MTDNNPYLTLAHSDSESAPVGDTSAAVAAVLNGRGVDPALPLRMSLNNAVRQKPDYEAELRRLAKQTGVPVDAVRSNPDEVKEQAAFQAFDFMDLVDRFPNTAKFLSDPNRAAVAHDDVENLSQTENVLRAWEGPAPSAGSVLTGMGTALGKSFQQAKAAMSLAMHDAFFDDGSPAAQVITQDLKRKAAQAQAQVDHSTPEFESSTARGVYAGGVSLAQNAPGIIASLLTANPTPGLLMAGAQSGLPAYSKYRNRGASPGMAALGGGAEGAVEMVTEKIPMGFMVSKFGKAGAGEFLTGLLARELPSEQVATFVQDAIDTSIANPDKTWGDFVKERPDAAYQTALATLVQAGAMGTVQTIASKAQQRGVQYRAAEQGAEVLDKINELAKASKLRERDPQSFGEFIKDATQDGPVKDIYIDASALQQSGAIDQVAAASPAVAAQLPEALASGGQVRIPVEEFASQIAGQDFAQSLIDHLKTDPNGFSRAEAQEFMQTQGEALRAEVEKTLQERDGDQAFKESRDRVQALVAQQLDSAKRFTPDTNSQYANLVANFYAVQGAKVGINPEEMAQRYPLRVVAENPVQAGQVLNQDSEAFKAWFGDSKVVDAEGKPLVVYHGTTKDFKAFNPKAKQVSGDVGDLGAFFTDSARYASAYTEDMRGRTKEGGRVLPVYVSLTNPKVETIDKMEEIETTWDKKKVAAYKAALLRGGHDGIIFKGDGASEFVAFDPEQIKSATGNDGTYDANDPSILSQGEQAPRGTFNPDTNTIALLKAADLSTFLHEAGHFFLEVQADMASRPDAPESVKADTLATLKWMGITGTQKDLSKTKAVGPDGQPLTVYHGTDREFDTFEEGMFTSNRDRAANYAMGSKGRVVEAHLDIRNPMPWADAFGKSPDEIAAAGFDGTIQWGGNGEIMRAVVTRPEQVKLTGRTPLDVWNAMSLEEQRPYHEQWARGFEAYLFEGKSPNLEMSGVFQRFRAWLLSVYKSINALNVELNDEIRGVFDRMLASTEQIKAAEAAREFGPMFTPEQAAEYGVDWQTYHELGTEATQDAIQELETRSLRDMRWLSNARSRAVKALQREAATKRKAVREEVAAEVEAMPVYQAQAAAKALRKEGATVDKDALAEAHGFTSADHLAKATEDAGLIKDTIDAITDQRMLERYGDLIDQRAVQRAADQAVHNAARLKFGATELNALEKATGQRRTLTKAAKEFAENIVARNEVRHIRPAQYAAAEARASRAAAKALKAGKIDEAAQEKRNQLVQGYATRAAYNAQEEVAKALRYFNRFTESGTSSLSPDYKDQVDALLERYDLRKSTTNKEIAKRKSLKSWVESQQEMGIEPEIPEALLEGMERKSYKEMTLEELRGLVDTVKQIEHIGRLKQKLLTAKDQREFDEVVSGLIRSIEEHGGDQKADNRTRANALGRASRMFDGFLASHRKVASLAREMDGFKDGGPMWETLIRTMNTAGDREATMRADAAERLATLIKPVLKAGKMGGKGQFFPSINQSLNREERIGIALNMGNAGNTQRLLDGEGWTRAQVQPVLDTLTKEDWQFVQSVWDFFESYRPEIGAKEKRVYGKEPEWVEPVAVQTAHGEFRGGYFPVKYDPRRSGKAEQHADAEAAKQQMRGAYVSATTRRSFAKARADEVKGRPLLYSMDALWGGANEVIHDLSWHEWLIDANRILRAIDGTMRDRYGAEVVSQFKNAVKDIAAGEAQAVDGFERAVNHVRSGAMIAGLGFNMMNAAINVTGLTQSMVRVGPRWVAQGIGEFAKSPAALVRQVHEKSKFMELRAQTMNREINEIQSRVRGKSEARALLDRAMFMPLEITQLVVDTPTWWGAYQKALAEGNEDPRAVDLADQAVIDSQGGGQVKDLAAIQRGSPLRKLWTTFYGFFSTTYNLTAERTNATDFKDAKQVIKLGGDYLLLYSLPAVLGVILKDALTGGGDDWDDPEKLAKKLAGAQVSYLMASMVGVREVGAAAQKALGVQEFNTAYAGPAGLRFFQELDKLGQQVGQGEADKAFLRSAINVSGIVLHLPSGQANRTIDGIAALAEGKTVNPLAPLVGAPPKN